MYAIDYEDFGTPAPVNGAATVTVEVDGRPVTVPDGTSVMRAAALAGVKVPKLCATDTLKAFGSCRLCLVEIEGRKGYPASCTTTVAAGMKIRTQSDKLLQLRRGVIDLYVSDHPLECASCPAQGHCELEDMAAAVGITGSSYTGGAMHRPTPKDESNPYFAFDPQLCIVCSRCVRACDEIQGTFALTIQGRGFGSKVAASQDQPFLDSECVSCGACIESCPTGALTEKSIIGLGQPERALDTTCAYCGVGCGFKAEVRGEGADVEVVRMTPDRAGKANHGHACIKGRFAWGYATHSDRVLKPMIRETIRDEWREVSWEEAIGYAASEIRRVQTKYGRDSVGGITSSRCTNEETFLVQKLVRAAFGNNNVDTCARVCHSPTGYGLKQTFGESAGTQTFKSVEKSDVIMVIGANPTDAHPVFASRMKKRIREGARLIVADPRRIDLVASPHVKADFHLPLKPGTNVALLNALAHVVVTEGLAREAYVAERCEPDSYAKWKAFVAEPRNSPEESESITGVPAERVRRAARLYA
ncbi:MAG: 2Fe-2S iron-sulfur cluster binding domain-containing protein, partial [Gammaproteobacteria bacterium]